MDCQRMTAYNQVRSQIRFQQKDQIINLFRLNKSDRKSKNVKGRQKKKENTLGKNLIFQLMME
jgi:hypothetical protein